MKLQHWKLRRLWYLLKYVGTIIVLMALVGFLLVRTDGLQMLGRILISLDIILFAWMFVVVFDKVLRNKWIFTALFVSLISLGIFVYSTLMQATIDRVDWITDVDTKLRYLYPLDNALSVFFLSFGSHFLEYSQDFWYYLFHFLGYCFAAWVLFSLFGKKVINRTLYSVISRDKKCVFWGYSVGGKVLAKDMLRQKEFCQPVFVLSKRPDCDEDTQSRIFDELSDFGAIVVYEDFDGPFRIDGKRHFFMSENQDVNVSWALRMTEQFKDNLSRLRHKTYLHVRTEIEGVDALFQAQYQDNAELKRMVEVNIYSQSDLAARSFVQSHPILDLAGRQFKPSGRRMVIHPDTAAVSGECNVLLLGLGWSGYELLRKTVCDAQFLGDDFHFSVTVIDDGIMENRGRYLRIFETARSVGIDINVNPAVFLDGNGMIVKDDWNGLFGDSDIDGCQKMYIHSVNGYYFYRWLAFNDNIMAFDRIIVSLGNDELNTNTAMQLNRFRLRRLDSYHAADAMNMPERIFVQVKDYQSYSFYKMKGSPIVPFGDFEEINSVDVLVREKLDRVAKLVNYVYSRYDSPQLSASELNDSDAVEAAWDANDTNIFNQNSSRSVALSVHNTVRIAGGIQSFRSKVADPFFLERYAEMEHLRWNAFNVTCGVDVWPKADVSNRKGKLLFDGTLTKHACIVRYDELDEISQLVRSLGNVNEDYKEADRRIVRHFPILYDMIEGH